LRGIEKKIFVKKALPDSREEVFTAKTVNLARKGGFGGSTGAH
jgi:hypothetical protein